MRCERTPNLWPHWKDGVSMNWIEMVMGRARKVWGQLPLCQNMFLKAVDKGRSMMLCLLGKWSLRWFICFPHCCYCFHFTFIIKFKYKFNFLKWKQFVYLKKKPKDSGVPLEQCFPNSIPWILEFLKGFEENIEVGKPQDPPTALGTSSTRTIPLVAVLNIGVLLNLFSKKINK